MRILETFYFDAYPDPAYQNDQEIRIRNTPIGNYFNESKISTV